MSLTICSVGVAAEPEAAGESRPAAGDGAVCSRSGQYAAGVSSLQQEMGQYAAGVGSMA